MLSLTQQVQMLSRSVTTLSGSTSLITGHTCPITIIKKSKAFEGKTLKEACLFHSFFMVWVQDYKAVFVKCDKNSKIIKDENNDMIYDCKKIIPFALLYIAGNAAI